MNLEINLTCRWADHEKARGRCVKIPAFLTEEEGRRVEDGKLRMDQGELKLYDWVSAIVIDDWTNCEKIIKHLKNQKNICFKVLMA